jgi:hypothetical protein
LEGLGFQKFFKLLASVQIWIFSNWIGPSRPGMAWTELLAFLPLRVDGFDLLADA